MILKPFSPADAANAAALHLSCFPEPWPAHAFAALLGVGATGFMIADAGASVAKGLVLYRVAADEAEILTFAVHPEARNRGLGSRLLMQAIATLESNDVASLLLEVAKDNKAALSLYTRAGFQIVGERGAYYVGGERPVDAWIMSRKIASKAGVSQ